MDAAPDDIAIWIGVLIGFLALFIPLQQIFAKAGFSRLWALFALLGQLGMFVCWAMLAMRRWPERTGT